MSEEYCKNFKLASDIELKIFFPEVLIVWFRNGKCLKDYLVRAALPKIDNFEGSEKCGKGTCQVCDYVTKTNIFTTKACGESGQGTVESEPLHCNSLPFGM